MANQRKKGKKKIAFWLTDEEISILKEEAAERQLNMTDVVRTLLVSVAKKRGIVQK